MNVALRTDDEKLQKRLPVSPVASQFDRNRIIAIAIESLDRIARVESVSS
jgi:hypothetical protein